MHLKVQIAYRPTVILALLLTALSSEALCLLMFIQVDSLVHHELYQHGLQFSPEWSTPYWTYSNLFFGFTAIAIASKTAALLVSFGARKRVRTHPAQLVSITLIFTGAIALLASAVYTSPVLAFIGLGLTFWGVLILYIRAEDYAKKTLLDAATTPSLTVLNQLIHELDYDGRPIYLPPKYLTDPEASKTYIPQGPETTLPPPEHLQRRDTILPTATSEGLLITPPGAELATLCEITLGTRFTQIDLPTLQQALPRLLVDDLELAQSIEIETANNHIHVKIHNLTLTNPRAAAATPMALEPLLTSAIACALAKATGQPVVTDRQQTSDDGKDLDIDYTLLAEGPPPK